MELRGVERAQPGGVLVRHAGGVLPALRRDGAARSAGSTRDLRIGGPASAATGWVDEFLGHLGTSGAPLDFLSTHTYGNSPLDLRPALDRHGRSQVPVWWTEWGTTPTHFNQVGDTVFAAAFLLRGMRSALGRVGALSHWVASDHFEELGAPQELFHGGFGLLSVGNLRKPRFWALALLAQARRQRAGRRHHRRRRVGTGRGAGRARRRRQDRRAGLELHPGPGQDARRPAAGPPGPAAGRTPTRGRATR